MKRLTQMNLEKQEEYHKVFFESLGELEVFVNEKTKNIDTFLEIILSKLNPVKKSFNQLFNNFASYEITPKESAVFQIK